MGTRHDLPASDFFYMLADSAAMGVQYGHKKILCDAMKSATPTNIVETFANVTTKLWGPQFGANCFYDTECLIHDPARWQPTSRSWRWQKCTELAYLQAAPSRLQSPLFPSLRSTHYMTMPKLLKQCKDIFGIAHASPQTYMIATKYGAKKPKTTKVFFSNGSDDPWQRAAVSKSDQDKNLPELTINCDGCGHCVDLGSASPNDPKALTEGRIVIATQIGEWLKQ